MADTQTDSNRNDPWRMSAFHVADSLRLAHAICEQEFDTKKPDSIDVLAVFKAIIDEHRHRERQAEEVERRHEESERRWEESCQ